MRFIAAIAAVVLALAACSPQPAAEASPATAASALHPESGLPVIPLSVVTRGGMHKLRVEVASSPAEQARGLMFRKSMGPDEGMLFPRNPPDVASFWMKNTPLPLDLIFIGTDRKVMNIQHGEPYSLAPLASAGVTSAVLELNAGRAAELGIGPGTEVRW